MYHIKIIFVWHGYKLVYMNQGDTHVFLHPSEFLKNWSHFTIVQVGIIVLKSFFYKLIYIKPKEKLHMDSKSLDFKHIYSMYHLKCERNYLTNY